MGVDCARLSIRRELRYISSQAKAEARPRFATTGTNLPTIEASVWFVSTWRTQEDTILKPSLHAASYKRGLTEVVDKSALALVDGDKRSTLNRCGGTSLSRHTLTALKELINSFGDVGLVIIEPINNYKGKSKAISEDDMRPPLSAIANLAEEMNISILGCLSLQPKKGR